MSIFVKLFRRAFELLIKFFARFDLNKLTELSETRIDIRVISSKICRNNGTQKKFRKLRSGLTKPFARKE